MTDQLPFFEAKKLRPTFRKRDEVEKHTVLRELLVTAFLLRRWLSRLERGVRRTFELRRHVGGSWGTFDPIHVPRPIYGDESHSTGRDPRLMYHSRRHVVIAARAELRLSSIALKGGAADKAVSVSNELACRLM